MGLESHFRPAVPVRFTGAAIFFAVAALPRVKSGPAFGADVIIARSCHLLRKSIWLPHFGASLARFLPHFRVRKRLKSSSLAPFWGNQ